MIETWKADFKLFAKSLNLSRDDYKTMMEYIDEIHAVQPDHTADIGKKVSISCGRENDLISRQAALKELAVYIHLIDKTMGKGTLTDDACMEAAKSVLGEDELPAAQPATNCSEIPNSSDDTISRQAALDAIMGQPPEPHYPSWYAAQIEKLPAVQPEIIRCKDCKHRHVENMIWTCPLGLPGGENFFCGYGTEPYKGE